MIKYILIVAILLVVAYLYYSGRSVASVLTGAVSPKPAKGSAGTPPVVHGMSNNTVPTTVVGGFGGAVLAAQGK